MVIKAALDDLFDLTVWSRIALIVHLSDDESLVARATCQGKNVKQIAKQLGWSYYKALRARGRAMQRLEVNCIEEFIVAMHQLSLTMWLEQHHVLDKVKESIDEHRQQRR